MSRLSREEVDRIAWLARLRLTGAEREDLARELASILEHFEAIRARERGWSSEREEPGGGVPGGAGPEAPSLRADRVDSDPLRRPLSELAPAWEDGHFVVPRLEALDGGADGGTPSPGDEG